MFRKKTTMVPKMAEASDFGLTGPVSPVLVELFTSQGCSSCPPGDALISKLGRQGDQSAPVLVLSFHVDYWDYLGWKDPFSSASWTSRQRAYGQALQQKSIYTPEAVVQGVSHGVASSGSSIKSLIQAAPRFPAPNVHATFMQSSPSMLKVSLTLSLKFKVEGFAVDVLVAIYRNGNVTNCTKGENRGRILNNDFVVMGLQKACTIQNLPADRPIKGDVSLPLWDGFEKPKSGVVVFLQNSSTLEVLGAQQLDWFNPS